MKRPAAPNFASIRVFREIPRLKPLRDSRSSPVDGIPLVWERGSARNDANVRGAFGWSCPGFVDTG